MTSTDNEARERERERERDGLYYGDHVCLWHICLNFFVSSVQKLWRVMQEMGVLPSQQQQMWYAMQSPEVHPLNYMQSENLDRKDQT